MLFLNRGIYGVETPAPFSMRRLAQNILLLKVSDMMVHSPLLFMKSFLDWQGNLISTLAKGPPPCVKRARQFRACRTGCVAHTEVWFPRLLSAGLKFQGTAVLPGASRKGGRETAKKEG